MMKNKDMKQRQRVRPLNMVVPNITHQLAEATDDSDGTAEEDSYEKSSRQKGVETWAPSVSPSSSPSVSDTKKATDGKDKAPVTVSATFTVAPVATPMKDKTMTTDSPVRAPTIQPAPIALPTTPPSSKPIVSVPLSVTTSAAPTAFFVDTSTAPTTTPSQNKPITSVPTVQPSPPLMIRPTVAPTTNDATNTTNSDDKDIVLGNEQSDAVTDSQTGVTAQSGGKVTHGAIIGVVLAVIVSMIVSVMVLMARHKYVQKHGAYSTRRRRKLAQQNETAMSEANIDGDLQQSIKTVHIITNSDNDPLNTSPDRTYEIHLEEDVDDGNNHAEGGAHIYSQESSFISTSGGEEMESDLDQNIAA
jgi:hypothetical protein